MTKYLFQSFWSVLILFVLAEVRSYPFEVSDEECRSMLPKSLEGHSLSSQIVAPFNISLSQNIYGDTMKIIVLLKKNGPHFIRGLHIQARVVDCPRPNFPEQSTERPVGQFENFFGDKKAVKPVNCFGLRNSAVFNANWMPHEELRMKWFAPVTENRRLRFYATVVVDDHTFWFPVMSETIRHYLDLTEDDGRSCHSISFKETVDPQPQTNNDPDNSAQSLETPAVLVLISLISLWIVHK